MTKLLLACFLFVSSIVNAQIISLPIPGSPLTLSVMANPQPLQELKNNPAATAYNLGDDNWANVPLPFSFPFYGQSFTDSVMYSNGAVQFGANRSGSNGSFCCQGLPLSVTTLGPQYNYSIMPLWTDLIGGTAGRNHYTLSTNNTMTYGWYGVQEYGTSNRNSFELKIDSSGGIDMRWAGALVTAHPVTIGTIGDSSRGEFTQNYHSPFGINIPGLTQLSTGIGTIDMCMINPLSSSACSNYAAAYTQQQCLISSLYDPTCPGYAQAYLNQQCSINTLYNESCPGYATAYLNQQCSLNPLYSTTCNGYAAAYKAQQCSLNPLYATDCPGYAQAYLNDQCLKDSLYSKECSGYSTAYAIKYLVPLNSSVTTAVNSSLSNTAATRANDPTNTIVATNAPSTTVNNDGTVSTGVSTTGNTTIDNAIASRTTSVTPNNPVAPVNIAPQSPQTQQLANTNTQRQEQKVEDKKDTNNQQSQTANAQQDKKEQPKTARQELAERRMETARAEAAQKGKNSANEMGKAESMEQQVAVQNVVIQAMGYTPGFDNYARSFLPGGVMYKEYSVYDKQQNVDNVRLSRSMFGSSNTLHNEIVDSQYNKGK
jgi:hypothetical protein